MVYHLLSVTDITYTEILQLLKRAIFMKDVVRTCGGMEILKHRVLALIFYEPSTRTSCSFQAAMLRLGGSVINVDVELSSIQKGESLEDTIRTLSCYTDAIVMRHPLQPAVLEAASVSSIPVINAGDGIGEHPTQALLDLFTIYSELGRIGGEKQMTITLVGDLTYGRTAHSLAKVLCYFSGIRLIYVSPGGLSMPLNICQFVHSCGVEQLTDLSLEEAIKVTDVLYVTRIQKERFDSLDEYEKAVDGYCVNAELMKLAKKDMIVMHPLPRLKELSCDIDGDPRAAYFRQMKNGMYMRMAILEKMMA